MLIPDQIQLNGITLNPILYFSFNDDSLINFTASYTIDNVDFENDKIEGIIKQLTVFEISGAQELIIQNKNSFTNHEYLYGKSIKVDTSSQYFQTITYSIAAIP